jgi:hypothetical protein
MTRKECLDILDLPVNASREDIVKAYRQLVQVWHPDRFPNNPDLKRKANAKLAEINEAYSNLINGTATQDPSENPPDGQAAEPTQENASESSWKYIDHQVRYLGDDPRLKSPSPWSAMIAQEGTATHVTTAADGITLATLNKDGPDEVMWYSASSLLAIEERGKHWVRPTNWMTWDSPFDALPPEVVQLFFTDPERILNHLIQVKLKFRNAYFAQLFTKRIQAITSFIEWRPPPPPVQVKPSETKPDYSKSAVWIGVSIGVLFTLTTSHQRSEIPPHKTLVKWTAPSYAITRGKVSVWTEPEKPQAGKEFLITIAVRPVEGIEVLPPGDVFVRVIGSDSYQQSINYRRPIPLENGVFTVQANVPPAPAGVTTRVSFTSKVLKEGQTFVFAPTENQTKNDATQDNQKTSILQTGKNGKVIQTLDGLWHADPGTIVRLTTEGNNVRFKIVESNTWATNSGGLLQRNGPKLTGVLEGKYDLKRKVREAFFQGIIASDDKIIATESLLVGTTPITASAQDMSLSRKID